MCYGGTFAVLAQMLSAMTKEHEIVINTCITYSLHDIVHVVSCIAYHVDTYIYIYIHMNMHILDVLD